MSWEIVVIIAIVAAVLLAIPVIVIMWKVSKRTIRTFDEVSRDMREMDGPFRRGSFESLDERVKRMTGPTNPFGKF